MRLLHFTIIVLCVVLISSCASNKLTKKANELVKAGMYEEASNYYINALSKKNDNIEAQIGLKQVGTLLVDDYSKDFISMYKKGDYKGAVYEYQKIEEYITSTKQKGVKISPSSTLEEYYSESLDIYLNQLYNSGAKAIDNKEYNSAKTCFSEIVKLSPNYRDSKELLSQATYIPVYDKGVSLMSQGKYRSAYYNFDNVIRELGDNYKDVAVLKEDALNKALIPIAILPVKNKSKDTSLPSFVTQQLTNSIANIRSPFIKLVETTNSDVISQKQYDAVYNNQSNSRIDVGQKLGAKALLFAEITTADRTSIPVLKTNKIGYTRKSIRYKDAEGKNRVRYVFTKVYYQDYKSQRGVKYSLSTRLSSVETGEVMVSKVWSGDEKDQIHFAVFDGDVSKLYSCNDVGRDVLNGLSQDNKAYSHESGRTFRNLFSARKQLKSFNDIEKDIATKISQNTASMIKNYNPER